MELSLSTSPASPAVLRRQPSPLIHNQQVLGVSFASALKPGGALRFCSRRRPLHRPITCSASPSTAEPSSGKFLSFLSFNFLFLFGQGESSSFVAVIDFSFDKGTVFISLCI